MKKIYFLLAMLCTVGGVWGQVSLTNGSPTVTIDFSSSTPTGVGTNTGTAYAGAGFSPNPTNATPGRLNSNAWAVTGWSNGVLAFGGTQVTASTDYTRGATNAAGGPSTGGFYAYTGSPATATDPIFLIQPGGSDFAPGTLTLRIQNNGTTNLTQVDLSYNIYVRNDQGRSSSFNFSYSVDDVSYTAVGALDYTSTVTADALGLVIVGTAPSRTTSITGISLAPGEYLYIRWSSADVAGSGSRDELGLDDISLTGTFASGTAGTSTITAGSATEPASLSSLVNTSAAAVVNFDFTINEDGGVDDADPTRISQIVINQGTNNNAALANWTQAILGAELNDGTTTVTGTVNAANITFASLTNASPGDFGYVADNGTKTYSLKIWLNPTLGGTLPVNIDGKQFEFLVQTSGVTTVGAGSSSIAASQSVSSGVSTNVVDVTATKLRYIQNTTNPTGLNVAMAPAVTVSADDANNNRDLDFVAAVEVTSSGTLTGSPVSATAVAGLATFATLTHTVIGTGLTLNAERAGTLDWDIVSNTFDIQVASSPSDYFRSIATGTWNATTTWESSADNSTWIPATITPTSAANTISIRNGHVVSVTASVAVDQVVVENGGTLVNNVVTANSLTIDNGASDDLVIESGGVYQVLSAVNYATAFVPTAGATMRIKTGGILRVGNGASVGGSNNNYAITATTFIWENGSILDWNSNTTPGFSGQTYFPDASASEIPILRYSVAPGGNLGGSSATVINGVFEPNVNVTWQSAGTKTFRNGIAGTGNIGQSASGQFIINGTTAVLGGSGTLTLPTNGLSVGAGTTLTMTASKTLTGNLALQANSYVVLGAFNLVVTGTLTGGSATSYVVTDGAGTLTINNVGATNVLFPVGPSTSLYHPATINNAGTADNFSVRVSSTVPCIPAPSSVTATWDIAEGTAGGSNCTLSLDYTGAATGGLYTAVSAKIFHCNAGGEADYQNGSVTGTVATGAGFTSFSPFGISSDVVLLPISLPAFNGTKAGSVNNISWKANCYGAGTYTFELQRSNDGSQFKTVTVIAADEVRCQQPFAFADNSFNTNAVNYYRLKIIDIDGKVSYSRVISLINKTSGIALNSIMPSVVSDNAVLVISAAKGENINLVITDVNGRVVTQLNRRVVAGTNNIELNFNNLQAGIYLINGLTATEKTPAIRFVKQ